MTYDFFLAHAGADTARAMELYDALAPDVRVFLDQKQLLPGDVWPRDLARAQERSRATVLLVSRHTETAYYFGEEIHRAIALHRARPGEHRAIPVYLDGTPADPAELPYGLRVLHGLDATKEGGLAGIAARLRELVTRLRELPTPVTPPPVTPPPVTPPPASGSSAPPSTAPLDAAALHERLCRLTEPQFETFLLYTGLPREQIRPSSVALAERALDVVMMAQQGDAALVARIEAALGRVAPWMKK